MAGDAGPGEDTYPPGTETPPSGNHSVMKIRVLRLGENLNVKGTTWLPGLSLVCQVLHD